MLLFFEGFQAQNVLIFFLSLMKPSYLSTAKIIPCVDNPLSLRDIGEIEYFNTTYEEYKVIYPMEYPITSQKMTLNGVQFTLL